MDILFDNQLARERERDQRTVATLVASGDKGYLLLVPIICQFEVIASIEFWSKWSTLRQYYF